MREQVSVQRRETERQTEMRLKSYSHHAKREGEEPWVPLQLHGADSAAAHSVWGRLTSPAETPVPMNMSRAEYLDSFVPGTTGRPNTSDLLSAARNRYHCRPGRL